MYENFVEQLLELQNMLEDDISKNIFNARILKNYNFNCSYMQLLKNVSDKTLYVRPVESWIKCHYSYEALCNQQILSFEDKIVLFGLSEHSMNLFEVLGFEKIKNLVWCVKKPGTLSKACGKPVISYQDLILNYRDYKFVLMESEIKDIINIYKELVYIGFNKDKIFKLGYTNRNQYFDDIVKLSLNEIFVDLGGFDGGTSIEFAKRTNYTYKQIYIFEPDPLNYENTLFNINNSNLKNVEIFNIGGWSKKDTLNFNISSRNTSSRISDNGNYMVKVNSLDNVLGDTPVTFIKMDVEGAELEALIGAEKIVKKYKPHLAISLYHRPEDIFEIPLYVKKLVPEYKLYLRHYSLHYSYETVLHAFVD
ncbi:hypothetical protein AN639_12060 [Candidatus Epulonipiscium fishelsonii]|nr:hypothetical protein AN639_12060 [Epulopiscium sp. SCG-B05WGA-EpuloA1]